jgi:hypothetical protein
VVAQEQPAPAALAGLAAVVAVIIVYWRSADISQLADVLQCNLHHNMP